MTEPETGHDPTQDAAANGSKRNRTKRIWVRSGIIAAGIVVVLVAAFFVADASLRAYAQGRVADEVAAELPAGVSAKDLDVSIGGFSVIGQYLSGSLDTVKLRADNVRVGGVPISASLTASGIPTDLSQPVRHVRGTLTISQDAVNKLVTIPGATSKITFGNGTLGYSGSGVVYGFPVSFRAVVKPVANGSTILLTPESVTGTGGSAQLDLNAVVAQVLGNKPFPFCSAQYLPDGMNVTDIHITPNQATVTVSASNIVLDAKSFGSRGGCT